MFEKCDVKLRKCLLDLRFLLDCKKKMLFQSLSFLNWRLDTLKILMYTRSAKSDCWKKKSNQRKRGLIHWKRMHRGLRKNYKERYQKYL